jgi:hypothetical protein
MIRLVPAVSGKADELTLMHKWTCLPAAIPALKEVFTIPESSFYDQLGEPCFHGRSSAGLRAARKTVNSWVKD